MFAVASGYKSPGIRREPSSFQPVSELLTRWRAGDSEALRSLIPLVYHELRRVAHHHLRAERDGHTLQSTALVNEVYLRLMKQGPQLESRAHFFAVASGLMRQILVEYARTRKVAKRDGEWRLTLDEAVALPRRRDLDLVRWMMRSRNSAVWTRSKAGLWNCDISGASPLKRPRRLWISHRPNAIGQPRGFGCIGNWIEDLVTEKHSNPEISRPAISRMTRERWRLVREKLEAIGRQRDTSVAPAIAESGGHNADAACVWWLAAHLIPYLKM